jgi:hypothetical protein
MKRRGVTVTRVRVSRISHRKLAERNAILYCRELERWNTRRLPASF